MAVLERSESKGCYNHRVGIAEIWARIESWLATHAPELLAGLLPGLTEAALARFEAALGVQLPNDLRYSLSYHAGQRPESYGVLGVWTLLAADESLARWRMLNEVCGSSDVVPPSPDQVLGPVQLVWWTASWIPIAGDGAGSLLCADLAPADSGAVGQIVLFLHDEPWREVVAPSFHVFLARFADDLDAGRYRVERAHGDAWLVDMRAD